MEKILIIEDNTMMRLFLTNYLSNQFEVVTAENPQEGLSVLNEAASEFSLVISDYYASGSPEYKTLEHLHMVLRWQNVPLVILTDQDKSDQRIAAFEAGANDCLSKPFNPNELTLRIKGLVKPEQQKVVYRPVA